LFNLFRYLLLLGTRLLKLIRIRGDLSRILLMRRFRGCGSVIGLWLFRKGGLIRWLFKFLIEFLFWLFLNLRHTALLTLRVIIIIKHRVFGVLCDDFLELTFDPTFLGTFA
jgi:hypothetical protein